MKNIIDIFIGSYTQKESHVNGTDKGIYWLKLDSDSLNVEQEYCFNDIINPSFIFIN